MTNEFDHLNERRAEGANNPAAGAVPAEGWREPAPSVPPPPTRSRSPSSLPWRSSACLLALVLSEARRGLLLLAARAWITRGLRPDCRSRANGSLRSSPRARAASRN